ncbi:Major Facilitator Superfamily (MFS), partial [Thraustotheca clavata]
IWYKMPTKVGYQTLTLELTPPPSPSRENKRLWQWRLQMFLINLVEFSAESSRGIVMPTLFLYTQSLGGSLYEMGLLTSVFSVGRLISSTVFGWLCDRYSFRFVYILSSFIGFIGNIAYLFADMHVYNSVQILLLSRFIVGFGAGNRSVCRANVAAITHVDQRLKYLTILAMVVFLGYALTPGLGGVMNDIDFQIFGLHIHKLTAPGLLLAAMNLGTILLMIFVWEDTITLEDAPEVSPVAADGKKTIMTTSTFVPSNTLVYRGVFVFILLNVVARGILSIFETVNVPIFIQITGHSNTTAVAAASSFQFNMGLLGLFAYLAIELWRHAITDVMWLLIGFGALALGNFILILDMASQSYTELAIGIFFVWSVGSPLTTAVCVAAFSKTLGSRQQGMWMGILGSAASVSRIIMPLLPALFPSFAPLFWLNLMLCLVSIGLLIWSLSSEDGSNRLHRWYFQLGIINFIIFGAEASRGIVMSTLFLYCKSLGGGLYELGLITSFFSIGRLISSTLFGYLCDKFSFRAVYILSALIGVVGNFIYFVPDPHTLLLSRFLVGFSSGILSVCRSNVASLTLVESRLKYLTILAISVYIGYALTPGLAGFMTKVSFSFWGLQVNSFTAPAMILLLLHAIAIMLLIAVYDDTIDVDDGPPVSTSTKISTTENSFILSDRLVYTGVGVFILLNVVARGVLSIYETINIPLFIEVTGDRNDMVIEAASSFQFDLGLVGLLAYLAIELCPNAMSEFNWLVVGFASLAIGNFVLALKSPPSIIHLYIGVFFLWSIGSPITTAVCVSALSKILGTRQQGKWMGLLGSAASMSRIILPMLPPAFTSFTPLFCHDSVLSNCHFPIFAMAATYGSITTTAEGSLKAKRLGQWYSQMALVNFVIFGAESSRGMVMPTLFLYCTSLGGGLYEMGILTSIFSVGRLISSTVLGWLSDTCSFRSVYLSSAFIGLLGNIVYFVPDLRVLILSRFLIGLSSGCISVCRSNVAAMTPVESRLKYLTILAIAVYFGYALTPGISGFMTGIDGHIFGLHVNAYTAPAFVLGSLNIISAILMITVYDDSIDVNDGPDTEKTLVDACAPNGAPFVLSNRLVYTGVALFIALNFVARGVLSIYETINVPLFMQVTHMTNTTVIEAAASFQFSLGMLGLLAYLAIEIWHHSIADITWLIIGYAGLALGYLILAIPSYPSFTDLCIGVFFLWSVGSPITTAVCVSALSKTLGSQNQGKWMGFLGSAASVSRIIMPMLPAAFATFTPIFSIGVAMSLTGVLLLILYDRAVKIEKASYYASNVCISNNHFSIFCAMHTSTKLSYDSVPTAVNPKVVGLYDNKRRFQWTYQMVLINLVEFSAESSRGIILPTLFLYCQSFGGDITTMGLLTSVFSVGRLISSTALGWMCDRYSFRFVYIVSMVLSLIGNLMYVLADVAYFNPIHVLMVSRFVVGFGAGNRSVCRANVAAMTHVNQRLKYLTILGMVVFLGYALTPGIGGLLTGVDFNVFGVRVHELTAPGLILALLNFFMIILMMISFDDSIGNSDAPEASPKPALPNTHTMEEDTIDLPQNLIYWGIFVFMVLNMLTRGILAIFETINVPYFLQVTGHTSSQAVMAASSFQFNLGLLGLFSYLAIEIWRHSISDVAWLLLGFGAGCFGNFILMWDVSPSMEYNQMAIGIFFVWSICSPLTTAVCVAAFSKILGTRQQGAWMGILGSVASISRIIMPLLPALFSSFKPIFWINFIVSAGCMAMLVWYDRLVKIVKRSRSAMSQPLCQA